jgi:hypothetical protein
MSLSFQEVKDKLGAVIKEAKSTINASFSTGRTSTANSLVAVAEVLHELTARVEALEKDLIGASNESPEQPDPGDKVKKPATPVNPVKAAVAPPPVVKASAPATPTPATPAPAAKAAVTPEG